MNLTEVKKSLDNQFARELAQGSKRNIIFWYDEDGVFADSTDTLDLENATIIVMHKKLIPEIIDKALKDEYSPCSSILQVLVWPCRFYAFFLALML